MPSKSPAQHKLMEIAAHTKGGYGGVPQKVGKEFVKSDEGKKFAKGGNVINSLKNYGFYEPQKSKEDRLKIVSKATTKPQRVEMVEKMFEKKMAEGGSSKVNQAGNYTKPEMRKRLFDHIKGEAIQGTGAGQWSARKAQLLAKQYKEKGGGYK
jgi:hypothetical protein